MLTLCQKVKVVIVDVEWVMLAFIMVVYYISSWGGQTTVLVAGVTLMFQNFGENINNVFWGCLLLTNE